MRAALLSSIIVALGIAGCGSEDDRAATFSYVYATVIEPNCTTIGCHNSFVATYGVELDTLEGAYVVLVGRGCDAPELPGEAPGNFVVPGHPDRSRLVYLLEGESVARRMPPDVPLPGRDIDLVRQWILDGAVCD